MIFPFKLREPPQKRYYYGELMGNIRRRDNKPGHVYRRDPPFPLMLSHIFYEGNSEGCQSSGNPVPSACTGKLNEKNTYFAGERQGRIE